MNRNTPQADYSHIVGIWREMILDVSYTTDIIAGFPGETEKEFQQTYKFLENRAFKNAHLKFSPREGTKAAVMKNQVDGKAKEQRSREALLSMDLELEKKIPHEVLDKCLPCAYEQKVSQEENLYEGYTPNYIKVLAESSDYIGGKIIKTRTFEDKDGFLRGFLLK
jgi:threonylcarbamoyladenosine tRNA methylthiotransferase MtaB